MSTGFTKPSFSVALLSSSFLARRMFSVGGTAPIEDLHIECTVCKKDSKLAINKKTSLSLQCGHMIQCTECRDYNLEKMLRCERCCIEIVGIFPSGCSPNCPRNSTTVKATALCAVCGSHLRKEARCCKSSPLLKECKKKMRRYITVLVQNPSLIKSPTPQDRPCSHYTLCQFCKNSVTKGHRSSTACKLCRTSKKRPSNPIEYTEAPPLKKQCTLGTLAQLAETFEESESASSSKTLESPEREHPHSPRFGESVGSVPVWALLNIR